MEKKKLRLPFRGRDAVLTTAIWIVVFLLVTYLLNKAISTENLVTMFVGLTVFLLVSILLRNGW